MASRIRINGTEVTDDDSSGQVVIGCGVGGDLIQVKGGDARDSQDSKGK